MAKKDNRPVLATAEQRQIASEITHARRYEKEWRKEAADAVDRLRATVDGEVDITLVTETNDEVATINEQPTGGGYDYAAFFEANPHLKPHLEPYKKVPGVSTVVRTKWVEQAPGTN